MESFLIFRLHIRAIYEMYKSEDERDKEIMDELCELIVERHKK